MVKLILAVNAEVCTFGQVLSNEAIYVLVVFSIPRTVRIAKYIAMVYTFAFCCLRATGVVHYLVAVTGSAVSCTHGRCCTSHLNPAFFAGSAKDLQKISRQYGN